MTDLVGILLIISPLGAPAIPVFLVDKDKEIQ